MATDNATTVKTVAADMEKTDAADTETTTDADADITNTSSDIIKRHKSFSVIQYLLFE